MVPEHSYRGPSMPQQPGLANKRFHDDDLALPVPQDLFFSFAITTLIVLCDRPAALMNCLVTFLTTQVVASISKLNRRKCCLKADVIVDNVMCTLKARCYQQDP